MYGSPLVLPGKFLSSPERPLDNLFTEFHNHLTKLTQIQTRHNVSVTSASPSQLPNQLLEASFVLVCRDNHISPLDTRYEGPYKVVKRSLHTLQLQIGNKKEVVSIHRLKPPFVAKGTQPAQPAVVIAREVRQIFNNPHRRRSNVPNMHQKEFVSIYDLISFLPFHPPNLLHQDVPFVSLVLLLHSAFSSRPRGLGGGHSCGGQSCLC